MSAEGHCVETVAADLARRLISATASPLPLLHVSPATSPSADWARSGAMALTGDVGGPPLAPSAPAPTVVEAATALLGTLGMSPLSDGAALLGERGALLGLSRGGQVSCGGATRLLRGTDGWVAVALARPEDWAAVPAWLDGAGSTWDEVARALESMSVVTAAETARLLGLPCSVVPDRPPPSAAPWSLRRVTACRSEPIEAAPLVVDLSALWAGPLCTSLLARCGAVVVKVEDPRRPDGGRRGMHAFYDLLNAGKRSVAGDLRQPFLLRLLQAADVVVTSSRRRAIEQLGVDPDDVLSSSPTVWVAVTGHGWEGSGQDRVGFGDDAAASAGLVAIGPDDGEPRFAGDAIADPLCGSLAALAALACLRAGGSWMVDAPLAGAARYAAALGSGRTTRPARNTRGLWTISGEAVAVPRARPHVGTARALGADTAEVTRWLAGSRHAH